MPDKNKLKVLQDINYKILRTCANCKHAELTEYNEWGTCKVHKYQHGKHTGDDRGVSIHKSGTCKSHDYELMVTFRYGAHDQFKEP